MTLEALDLFSGGAGGWSLACHRLGIRTLAACEADPARRHMYAQNFPEVPIYDDVQELTAARLLADLGTLPHIVVGSPPCQDASVANPRGRGTGGKRTGLAGEFVRLVGEVRPLLAVLENVPGLKGRGADWLLASLAAAGYAARPFVVGAIHAGAPHRRLRCWIVAVPAAALADPDRYRLRLEQQRLPGRRPAGLCDGRQAEPRHPRPIGASDADQGRQPGERLEKRPGIEGASGLEPVRPGAHRIEHGPDDAADADQARREAGPAPQVEERPGEPDAGDGRRLAREPRRPLPRACPDADEAGCEGRHRAGGAGAQEAAPTGVDWLDDWHGWNGGCGRHLRLADGLSPRLARQIVAALDALEAAGLIGPLMSEAA
ncbi:MAG: DNA cytosine methyltransferase [Geminicoccaceae bacterium]|nr:DNA cytosine methyltransferase [Geminicoccaceae bacterium]